jgi:hypothetical protein
MFQTSNIPNLPSVHTKEHSKIEAQKGDSLVSKTHGEFLGAK